MTTKVVQTKRSVRVEPSLLPHREMLVRMRTFVPGPTAGDLIATIERWARCSGAEWTVQRLKRLRMALLMKWSGQNPDLSWISCDSGGVPKGPFGYLFRLGSRNRAKAWNALMSYTGFRALRITPKQYNTFIQALRSVEPEHVRESRTEFARQLRKAYGTVSRSDVRPSLPIYRMPWSRVKTAPHDAFGVVGPEYKNILDPVSYTTTWRKLYPEVSGPLLQGFTNLDDPLFSQSHGFGAESSPTGGPIWGPDHLKVADPTMLQHGGPRDGHWGIVGMISAIQEPGYKLRFVANPFRVYQAAHLDAGKILWNALRSVKEDYTYNQLEGIQAVQSALRKGKRVFSFDLENATDRFPRTYLQEVSWKFWDNQNHYSFWSIAEGRWVLDKRRFGHFLPRRYQPGDINNPSWCERELSSTGAPRACYRPDCSICFVQDEAHADKLDWDTFHWVSWNNGVPLGLFPSFPMFALAHHSILVSLLPKRARIRPWAIVGDDVCIWDDNLAADYHDYMVSLGCIFNESKTIASSECAEFLGHVVFRDTIIPRYKWRSHNDDSFFDLVRSFGLGLRPLLSPRQKRIVDQLAAVPEPLGLGLNPRGLSFMERLEPWLDPWLQRFEDQKVPIKLIEPETWLNRQLYPSWWMRDGLEPDLPDRGERENVMRSLGLYGLEEHLLNCLEDPDTRKLLSDKLRNPTIRRYIESQMTRGSMKSRLTNLEKFERLVKGR